LIVQKPPTAQNYAIGCKGLHVTGVKPPAPFDESQGFIEGTNTAGLYPQSLYLAQLEDRLGVILTPQTYSATSNGNWSTMSWIPLVHRVRWIMLSYLMVIQLLLIRMFNK